MMRSWLYVPGDRPDRAMKVLARTGPDAPHAVILDLEDSVAPSAKETARRAVVELLDSLPDIGRIPIWVRLNAGDTGDLDIESVATARPDGVYLPKATVATVGDVARRLDDAGAPPLPIVALVESAQGLLDAPAMARHPRVRNLALGEVDLRADLGIPASAAGASLTSLRLQIVVASAAAGIEPPTGPVSTDFADLTALAESTRALRDLGFGARSVIHPDQIGPVNDAFRPTDDEMSSALLVVEAYDAALARGDGAIVAADGTMIDEAVVRSARRLLR